MSGDASKSDGQLKVDADRKEAEMRDVSSLANRDKNEVFDEPAQEKATPGASRDHAAAHTAQLLKGIGVAEIERIICNASAIGEIEGILPRNEDAWRIAFPSLESLPVFEGSGKRLHACIATEEITGPVRNGGIGTTYAYLSEMLAQVGCDTTILYLRGQDIENGTVDDWVKHYGEKGIKFVPVPNYAASDRFQTGANRWLQAPYNMLRYLLEHPMDVVHVSEWHGSGYLSLLAKRQGLAFAQTLFIVKTSSPWLWNRLYGAQPLDRLEDLAKINAERQSVELADIVIGGSLHLLRWMASQGYRIPRDRTFVQPNLVFFDHLKELMSRRTHASGTRMAVDEIVFFGRLESRKGLFIFCQAIKRLVRLGVTLPKTITFMGKPGARLTARPDQEILDYIETESQDWPCEVKFLTNFQQYEALEYLLAEPRLAVMPSIIENSSMAVYEAAICGIPFIASAAGGTPELVVPEDHAKVLCEAHPVPLADKIAEALKLGAFVARPSFNNDANLQVWRGFHENLGHGLLEELLSRSSAAPAEIGDISFSICIYYSGDDKALAATMESLKAQDLSPLEAIVAVDAGDRDAIDRVRQVLELTEIPSKVVEAFDYDAGLAFNITAREASGEYFLFAWAGATFRPQALRALSKVARSASADVLNFFHRVTFREESEHDDYLRAIVLGSVSESFFRTDLTSLPVAIRAESFFAVDGFSTDYRVLGCEMELMARCQVQGLRCTTALMDLASVPGWEDEWLREKGYDRQMSQFRVIRPHIAAAPLAFRDLLLMARGLQLKPAKPIKARKTPKPPSQPEDKSSLSKLFKTLASDVFQTPESQAAGSRADNSKSKGKKGAGGSGLMSLIDGQTNHFGARNASGGGGRKKHGGAQDSGEDARTKLYRLQGNLESEVYTGRFLALHRGLIYGWARDEHQTGKAVEIHVFENGVTKAVFTAYQNLEMPVPLPGYLKGHCFTHKLKSSWMSVEGLMGRRRIRLGVGPEGAITLAEFTLGVQGLAAAGYEGCCDPNMYGVLHGWVWTPSDPDTHIDVAVFVDDMFLARITAFVQRDDLMNAGIGRGDHGFRLQLPKPLRDGVKRRITVVVADAGHLLQKGNLTLLGESLTPI